MFRPFNKVKPFSPGLVLRWFVERRLLHRKRGRSARASPSPHHTSDQERTARFTARPFSALPERYRIDRIVPLALDRTPLAWRQRGRVVRAPDLKSVGRGFKSHYVLTAN